MNEDLAKFTLEELRAEIERRERMLMVCVVCPLCNGTGKVWGGKCLCCQGNLTVITRLAEEQP